MHHTRVKTFHISRVVFQTMPLFMPVPVRGFTLSGDAESIQELRNLPGLAMGNLSPHSISARIPSLVQMDSAGTPLPINGGWGNHHCSALIEVNIEFVDGQRTMYRMRCYTDRSDFSPITGLPASDLGIFVNTIEEVRVAGSYTPVGMSGVNQIFYDATQRSSHSADPIYTVRPVDVLADLAFTQSSANTVRHAAEIDDAMHSSVVSMLTSVPQSTTVGSTTAPNWLASILNTYIDTLHGKETGSISTGDPIMMAVDALGGSTFYENPFIAIIARHMKYSNGSCGWMSWSHLVNIDPSLANDQQRVIHATNSNFSTESAELDSYAAEALIAQTVAVSVRPWMYASMISSVSFTATNMTLTGETDIQFTDKVLPLVNLAEGDRQGLVNMFIKNIATMLMPQITGGGRIPLHLVVNANHSSNITVVVTLGAGNHLQVEPKRYSFPAFMDNAYSGMLSHRTPADIGKSAHLLLTTVDMMRNKPLTAPVRMPHTQYTVAPHLQYAPQHQAVHSSPPTVPSPTTSPTGGFIL